MKKKVLISSICVIALCLCLIAGSTFALFTSTAEVNIIVTAGDLDVTAVVDESTIAMRSLGESDFERGPNAGEDEMKVFANGGTVSFNSPTFTITKMTPGDEIQFKIKVANGDTAPGATNENAIAAKCYFTWTSNVPSGETDLLEAMTFTVNGNPVVLDENVTPTYHNLPVGEEVEFTVVASFPDAANNNDYKNAVANINFMVVAVQANAQ